MIDSLPSQPVFPFILVMTTILTTSGSTIMCTESLKNTLSLIQHLPSSTPDNAALGMEVVDIYKVDIPMALQKELNAVTGSNQFRSQHQA